MSKIKMHYQSDRSHNIVKNMEDFIMSNDEVIIVNIGTDRCIGDALGPIVGTLLEERKCPLKVFGSMNDPIHAMNIESKLEEIAQLHPNAKVLGIDACLGSLSLLGQIQLRDFPIHPGKGVGKDLPPVGDMSMICVTDINMDDEDEVTLFTGRNIRLSFIYNIAQKICDIIMLACVNIDTSQLDEVASSIAE